MPIYPGDRIPEEYARQQQELELRKTRLANAGEYICQLLARNHELIMEKFERTPMTVMIPNGTYSYKGNPRKSPIVRDTWKIWSRSFESEVFENPDSYMSGRITRSEPLLVTPQKQFSATSVFPLDEASLYDLESPTGFIRMSDYIGRCATQNQRLSSLSDIDAVTNAIEAKVLR